MKKFAASCLFILAFLLTAACFAGCNGCNKENELVYGEKYGRDYHSFVFNADGTGKENRSGTNSSGAYSYTVDFLWQIQSDNRIYLVFNGVTYNDDHTANKDVDSACDFPLTYSRDMLTYTYVSGYMGGSSTYTARFIRQGSRLDVSND
ncbi:MAG: hypothetical protein K2K38_03220 [Clostridia bacterium]|nr:hypothetical protein [Clostridia bacterium]